MSEMCQIVIGFLLGLLAGSIFFWWLEANR